MNSSRLVAGIAALAIGFGVTLAGVAISDDDEIVLDATGVDPVDSVEPGEAVDENAGGAATDDEESNDGSDGDDAIQEETRAEEPDDAEVSEPLPTGTIESPPLEGSVEPDDDSDAADSNNDDPNNDDPNGGEPGNGDPGGDPDVAVLDEVRCVATISVVSVDGLIGDFVVLDRRGPDAWVVFDVDGAFLVSSEDFDVARIVEIDRNVVFFQEAPIDFLDTCDEVGGTSADAGLDLGGLMRPDASGVLRSGETGDLSCADAKICVETEWSGNH